MYLTTRNPTILINTVEYREAEPEELPIALRTDCVRVGWHSKYGCTKGTGEVEANAFIAISCDSVSVQARAGILNKP